MKVRVAITGTLSKPRKQIIELIRTKTNAVYTQSVDKGTDYLVAVRKDTSKAQAAAELGVGILTEAELFSYIDAGHIPPRLAYRQTDLRNPEECKAFSQKIDLLLPCAVPSDPPRIIEMTSVTLLACLWREGGNKTPGSASTSHVTIDGELTAGARRSIPPNQRKVGWGSNQPQKD